MGEVKLLLYRAKAGGTQSDPTRDLSQNSDWDAIGAALRERGFTFEKVPMP